MFDEHVESRSNSVQTTPNKLNFGCVHHTCMFIECCDFFTKVFHHEIVFKLENHYEKYVKIEDLPKERAILVLYLLF